MIMWIVVIVLLLVVAALGFACYKVFNAAVKINEQNQAWADFYEGTLDDLDAAINMLDQLKSRKYMISDDPDVVNVYRVIVTLYNILAGYRTARQSDDKIEV